MSSDWAIRVENLSKAYNVYPTPRDRLKQAVMPRLRRLGSPAARLLHRSIPERNYCRTFWALHDVSFELAPGEMLGVIGPNGAGKSTLLQLVCGTLAPTSGSVRTRGRVAALLELGSGFNPEFSGRENVYMNGMVLGLTRDEIEERFASILEFSGIEDFIDQPVKTYSSGMGMRLAFAVMAHVDADVLLVDEALAVGDAYFQQKCRRWLRQFRESGTVLFCGHDIGSVQTLCERAVWLDHGSVRALGPAKDICEAYLATAYARSTGLSDSAVRSAIAKDTAKTVAAPSAQQTQSLQIFEFNESSAFFGSGDATILGVSMVGMNGETLGHVKGGERVQIIVRIRANASIESPIVGFSLKDRLGQHLLGDNSYLEHRRSNLVVAPGQMIEGRFVFELPCLKSGDYSLSAAVASGTLEHHVQLHWLHDAVMFKVDSPYRNGVMIAIPMEAIELTVKDDTPIAAHA